MDTGFPSPFITLSPPHIMIRYEFPNKVVLVTGSSRGIGAAILSAFSRAGATTVLHFWDDPEGQNRKDAESLAAQLKGGKGSAPVHIFGADVRNAQQIGSLDEAGERNVRGSRYPREQRRDHSRPHTQENDAR